MSSSALCPSRFSCHACVIALLLLFAAALPLFAQDDVTTQNGSTALDGAWITGPASNPLSFLNGPAYRTFGSSLPYDFPDFRPISLMDARLPHWVAFEAEERFRAEGAHGSSLQIGNDDAYQLNRFRYQLDLLPSPWLKLVAQVQDARPIHQKPPIGPPNENRWDLKLAYAQFGDPEEHAFSLRIGRQLINYNNTVLANSEWRNQGRSYDAVALNLHTGRVRAGIFAASAVAPLASGISHHPQGNNIYGVYGRVVDPLPHSSLEPFVFWRVQPKAVVEPALSSKAARQNMWVYGLRFKGRLQTRFNYSLQAVVETGTVGAEPIRAWSAYEGVSYEFESTPARPRFHLQYDYASGNPAPGSGTHRTFDPVYSTAHDRFGILDLFGSQNIRSLRGGVTLTPHRRWTVTAQALDLWLDSARDAVYNTSGSVIAASSSAAGSHLGQEADAYSWYELNSHFNLGAGYGWFGAGRFLSGLPRAQRSSGAYFVLNFKDNGRRQEAP